MDYRKIDPALEFMKEFGKVTNGMPALIEQMRQKAIFSESAVPKKFKVLTAMIWAISARCEPCIKYYVHQALESGATEGEFGEFLAIASTMGGCVGEMWALRAFRAFKDQGGDAPPDQPPSCCV